MAGPPFAGVITSKVDGEAMLFLENIDSHVEAEVDKQFGKHAWYDFAREP